MGRERDAALALTGAAVSMALVWCTRRSATAAPAVAPSAAEPKRLSKRQRKAERNKELRVAQEEAASQLQQQRKEARAAQAAAPTAAAGVVRPTPPDRAVAAPFAPDVPEVPGMGWTTSRTTQAAAAAAEDSGPGKSFHMTTHHLDHFVSLNCGGSGIGTTNGNQQLPPFKSAAGQNSPPPTTPATTHDSERVAGAQSVRQRAGDLGVDGGDGGGRPLPR